MGVVGAMVKNGCIMVCIKFVLLIALVGSMTTRLEWPLITNVAIKDKVPN
jgi:hypothetical protein